MKILFSFLVALSIVVGGCVTRVESDSFPPAAPQLPESAPSVNRYPPAPTQAVSDKRIVLDPALQKIIRVVRVKSSVSVEGHLKVQLNVHNLTDSRVHFTYRVDWFDQDGQPLPMYGVGEQKWDLLAGETSFLAMTAPTIDIKDFRVTFLAD